MSINTDDLTEDQKLTHLCKGAFSALMDQKGMPKIIIGSVTGWIDDVNERLTALEAMAARPEPESTESATPNKANETDSVTGYFSDLQVTVKTITFLGHTIELVCGMLGPDIKASCFCIVLDGEEKPTKHVSRHTLKTEFLDVLNQLITKDWDKWIS